MTESGSWPSLQALIAAGEITLEPETGCALVFGRRVRLTPQELRALEALMVAPHAGGTSDELLDRVWDENVDPFTTSVRVTMMTLRRKFGGLGDGNGPDDGGGSSGVREPRRPRPRPASGGATFPV